MDGQTTIGEAAGRALTGAVTSSGQSMKDSLTSDAERKRHFLTVFNRWTVLFKRVDNASLDAEKWLIAEYFKSIGHLSPRGLEALTEELKRRCTFFPTIREILEIIEPPRYAYGNPFYAAKDMFLDGREPGLDAIGSVEWRREARLALAHREVE